MKKVPYNLLKMVNEIEVVIITRPFPETLCWRNRSMKRLITKMKTVYDENINIDEFIQTNPVYHQFDRDSFQRAFDTAQEYIESRLQNNEVYIAMESDEFDFDKWQETNDDDSHSDRGSDHESFSDISDNGSELGESTEDENEQGEAFLERYFNNNDDVIDDSSQEEDNDE